MRYGLNLLLWTDTLNDAVLAAAGRNQADRLRRRGTPRLRARRGQVRPLGETPRQRRPGADGRDRPRPGRQSHEPRPDRPPPRRRAQQGGRRLRRGRRRPTTLVGPFHSALGYFSGAGPTADEWRWAVDCMREVAGHAEKCKVTLALEYLNRFECYLLNTAADGARFCREVNHPRCQMMYDTFHSHIEEKNTPAAIRALKGILAHVHISENDRSTPGAGNVRWTETFDALHEIGYDNLLMIEAFGLALEKLAAATKIWRRMYQNERQLASDGLKFMKTQVARRWNGQ